MKTLKCLLSFAAMTALFVPQAQAQTQNEKVATPAQTSTFPTPKRIGDRSELRPHVGVIAGMASPEGSYYNAPLLGLNVGYQPYIPFSLGLSVTRSTNMIKGPGDDLERTTVLAQAAYNFGGSTEVVKNSWIGVAAGPVFRRDGTDTAIAPTLGFDIPIQQEADHDVTLGASAQYLIVNTGAPDTFNLNGVIKYWF